MKKTPLLVLTVLCSAFFIHSGHAYASGHEHSISFKFVAGNDMFYVPWGGNDAELKRLYEFIDRYHADITSGVMPVYVDGYCASKASHKENINIAFIRANRVKSELIVHKGLLERHFITKNYTTAFDGQKDIVLVTLRIPASPAPEPKPEPGPEPVPDKKPEPKPEPEPIAEAVPEAIPAPACEWAEPYCFALRTNLLHWAAGTVNGGIEWRPSAGFGLKVDGAWSHWRWKNKSRFHKLWMVNPEFRWYMGGLRRFYLGLGGMYGEFNMKLGSTGYQGELYGGGLTIGYQMPLGRCLSMDFNLGLGYHKLEYDSFTVINEVRVYKEKDRTKDWYGPTQAGISLVWRFGGNK